MHPEWGCEIIAIDTSTKDGKQKIATWFHWVPLGAFLLLDEAQKCFPKRWKEADLRNMDLDLETDERPDCWEDAWERHRHFNWDIVLTTPNISLIRPDIKACTEMCYLHSNLAVLGNIPGLKGSYIESQHIPDNSPRRAIVVQRRKISKQTWRLYDSTATGEIRDTTAGQSIFKSPRLLLALGILVAAFVLAGRGLGSDDSLLFGNKEAAPQTVEVHRASPPLTETPTDSSHLVHRDPVAVRQSDNLPTDLAPLKGQQLDIVASLQSTEDQRWVYLFRVNKEGTSYTLNMHDLKAMQYRIEPQGACALRLYWEDNYEIVTCGDRSNNKGLISGA